MTHRFKVVIPARFGSTRLPGKPLLEIAGRSMIRYVIDRALQSGAEEVVVATDDARIVAACADSGAATLLTAASHRSGAERISEVVAHYGWPEQTVIVNLQGDEPCMPAALIDQVAADLAALDDAGTATLATPITASAELFDPHVVKVVTDRAGFALYFSRAPLPWHRDEFLGRDARLPDGVTFLRHIGLYAYRAGFIRRYVALDPAPLETAESLEQLRILWHGEAIHVGQAVQAPGVGVDTLDDLTRAASWLAAEAGQRSDLAQSDD